MSLQCSSCLTKGAGRINHIINDNTGPAIDITDDMMENIQKKDTDNFNLTRLRDYTNLWSAMNTTIEEITGTY